MINSEKESFRFKFDIALFKWSRLKLLKNNIATVSGYNKIFLV